MLPKPQNLTLSHILFSIFLLHSFAISSQQDCNHHDQSSLLSFMANISISSSLSLQWPSSINCCQWEGIKCNINGSVTHLELPSRGLQGVIPTSSITKLVKLTHLNLSNNQLHGTMGVEFIRLTKLKILDLSSNNLFGFIPWKIGNLLYLEKLYLHTNNFRGLIPSSLKKCTNLVELSLRNNHFDGDISKLDLSGLVQLQKLDLRNNSLNGTLPESIYSCKSLVAIGLSLNNMTGQISSRIAGLNSLSYLSLSHNYFTNITGTIRVLAKCKSLSTLFLSNNFYNETLPTHENFVGLDDFPNLEIFDLANCNFGGPFPKWIAILKTLRHLNLNGNIMTGTIPHWLGTLPNLASLILSNNNFSGKFPFELCQLPALVSLSVETSSYFHFELPSFVFLPNRTLLIASIYRGVDLSYNSFDGKIPLEIGNLRNLQQLLLKSNYFSGNIPASISNLKKLEALDLSTNNLTGGIPTSLGGLSFLSEFDVSYNDLEGPIPIDGQLGTFSSSSFEGNPSLCGKILNNSCSNTITPKAGVGNTSRHHFMHHSFLNGLFVGFASGFSGVLAIVASYFWFKY